MVNDLKQIIYDRQLLLFRLCMHQVLNQLLD